MTNYHLRPPGYTPATSVWQERKAKRKKQLEEVRHRRRLFYQNYRAKLVSKQTVSYN